MASVKVTGGTIRHDHVDYKKGDVIADLTEKQAEQLVDSGEAAHTSAAKTTGGTKTAPKTSRVKEDLLANKTEAPRKSVAEKAQERAQRPAKVQTGDDSTDDVKTADELPVSFTTPDARYETNLRGTPPEGTDYFKDGEPIDEAEYSAAYEQSINDAGKDSQTDENKSDTVEFDYKEDHFKRGIAKNGAEFFTRNNKSIKKVEFLQAAGAAGVDLGGEE